MTEYTGALIAINSLPSTHLEGGSATFKSTWGWFLQIGSDSKITALSSSPSGKITPVKYVGNKYSFKSENGMYITCAPSPENRSKIIATGTTVLNNQSQFNLYRAGNGAIALLNDRYKHWLNVYSNGEVLCENNDET